MDGSSKVALAIVAAAALLVLGYVVYREADRQRTISEVNAGIQGFLDEAQRVEAQSSAQAAQQRQRDLYRQRDDLARRTLSSNQRCYGGAVVEVNGSTYTQLGTISNPIHCSGTLADRPLR